MKPLNELLDWLDSRTGWRTGRAHLRTFGNLRHRHVPPMTSSVGGPERVGIDYHDARSRRPARPRKGRFKST